MVTRRAALTTIAGAGLAQAGSAPAAHALDPATPVEPRFSLATKATRAER